MERSHVTVMEVDRRKLGVGLLANLLRRLHGMGWLEIGILPVPFLLAANASAQAPPPVEAGTRVRVEVAGQRPETVVATWVSFADGVLELEGSSGQTVRVPASSILSVDRSIGARTNGKRGAWLGFGVGAVGGAMFGKMADPHSDCAGNAAVGDCPLWLVTGVIFGAAGALVGSRVGKGTTTDVWERVPLDVALSSRGGVSLGWSMTVNRW